MHPSIVMEADVAAWHTSKLPPSVEPLAVQLLALHRVEERLHVCVVVHPARAVMLSTIPSWRSCSRNSRLANSMPRSLWNTTPGLTVRPAAERRRASLVRAASRRAPKAPAHDPARMLVHHGRHVAPLASNFSGTSRRLPRPRPAAACWRTQADTAHPHRRHAAAPSSGDASERSCPAGRLRASTVLAIARSFRQVSVSTITRQAPCPSRPNS